MVKISIIIPVYNCEKYLSECLKSLITQTLEDIEIICINDGSSDNSSDILNKFSQQDSRIKIINQANQGVSAARNVGISSSAGEYIMFLDGDDFYSKDACQKAYETIKKTNSDIGIFAHNELKGSKISDSNVNKKIQKIVNGKITPDYWRFQTFCWDKIYKSEFIKHNGIVFPTGIKTAEDGIFSLCCLFNKPKYCFINEALIAYRITKGSATGNTQAIKNDFLAFKTFYNMEIFQTQTRKTQLQVVEKFCSGIWNYYKKFNNFKTHKILDKDIEEFLGFIEQNYELSELEIFKKYRQLKNRNKNILFNLFYKF